MSQIKVRFAEEKDMKNLSDLLLSFENYFCELDHVNKKKVYVTENKLLEMHFSDNKFMRTFIAEQNGNIVGSISFYRGFLFEDPPCSVLHFPEMFVLPEFRNTDAVQKLLLSVRALAKKERINKLVFSVYGLNKDVRKHYEKLNAKYFTDENEHFMFFDVD